MSRVDGFDSIFFSSRIRHTRCALVTGVQTCARPIYADNPASLSQKLLQFCSGAVYDDKKTARAIHDHKIEELRQLIDELQGEPIMLVYWNSDERRVGKECLSKCRSPWSTYHSKTNNKYNNKKSNQHHKYDITH